MSPRWRLYACSGMRLELLEVLIVDCQACSAKGPLLEVGWGRPGDEVQARLIRLPAGERVPPAVARITGITDRLVEDGVEPHRAWDELFASLPCRPAPTVVHFARFEQPFFEAAQAPLDVVCTHEIARRLFPELPRRSLRALAGYFGHGVTSLRRAAEHVEATVVVWRSMVPLLAAEGVNTWSELQEWLAEPVDPKRRAKRAWPMPRELRLALPDAPGLYRMLRTSGDVLYVGKATSLHHRVNSYFRKQHGIHERTLEMLSQARGLSFEVTDSPLEAALLEPDEIKRHRPPYNVALTIDDRAVWFTDPRLSRRAQHASRGCELGPFPGEELLEQLCAFAASLGDAKDPTALGRGRWGPPLELYREGLTLVSKAHPELVEPIQPAMARILRLGARLWREGRRDRDEVEEPERREWDSALVVNGLERLALRGALAVRRARWLTRLAESSLVWSERGVVGARVLVISSAEFVRRAPSPDAEPPIPPGHARPTRERHANFTIAKLDRLRVLTTELKRLVSEQHPAALRLGPHTTLSGPRLARVLEWL